MPVGTALLKLGKRPERCGPALHRDIVARGPFLAVIPGNAQLSVAVTTRRVAIGARAFEQNP